MVALTTSQTIIYVIHAIHGIKTTSDSSIKEFYNEHRGGHLSYGGCPPRWLCV